MNEILLINPRKKRRTKRRAASKSTKRKTKRSTGRHVSRRTTITKRRAVAHRRAPRHYLAKGDTMAKKKRTRARKRPRKNPSVRHYAKRAVGRAKASFMGLNFGAALKSAPLALIGMLGSKWLAGKFNGGLHTDPETWQWDDYLKSAAGAAASGILMNMIKPGTGQRVMEGGMWLTLYYLLQNEVIQPSDMLRGQFGAEDQYYPAEYLGEATYQPGDVEYNSAGQPYVLGQDYQWQQLPEAMSGELQPVGPLGQLQPVGPLGNADDAYRKMLLGDA